MRCRYFILFLLMLATSLTAFSQETTNKKILKLRDKAKAAIADKSYDKATGYLDKIKAIDPSYPGAYIMQGDVYNFTLKSAAAAEQYNKGLELSKDPKPILYFIAAEEEVKCGLYEDAYNHYNQYLEKSYGNSSLMQDVEKGLKICKFGMEAVKHPVSFDPKNMGAAINSEWDEYLAALTADESELIYTVRRPRDEETVCVFCATEEDFYSSHKVDEEWQPREALGAPINSHYNEGAQCISPDGRYLFYTMCNTDFGYGSCDLYWSKRIGNRWSRPRNFGAPVNTEHWESQPTIAPDGKTIYFASNRPGGYGGVDIWKTEMLEEGVFSVPENLGGKINTKNDDTAPFIHTDGRTLYFASDGHPGLGGKDLFYSTLLGKDNWSEPVNLGYPINTSADEVNILINAAGNTAYFSSDKDGGYGGLDLYYFTLDEKLRPTPVTYIKGRIQDANTLEPLEATIELFDLKEDKTITSTTSDPITGEFLACILTGTNVLLNVSHPYYPFYSENFQIEKSATELEPFIKDISLRRAEVGASFILRNIFFEFDKSDLQTESFVELNKLVDYLNKNKSVAIEIGGYTDNQGSDEYNNKLSLNRAKAVYDYLVGKGIEAKRLSYVGYGKENPVATNDTEEGRAANRRTEFKIKSY